MFFIGTFFFAGAQSTLLVECYEANSGLELDSNAFYLNYQQQDYGIRSTIPSFYLGILDNTCGVWDNYTEEFGNSNVAGYYLSRIERIFMFTQNDSVQLKNLDSVLNEVIPVNHTFFIYTPISFNYSSVSSLYPPLGQTLLNNWGDMVIDARMMVLFGIKGYTESYDMDTTIVNGKISFEKTVCPNCSQNPPDAVFSISTDTVDLAFISTVNFSAQETNYDSLQWDFGDGFTELNSTNVSHNFTTEGDYPVTVSVYKDECSNELTQWIHVTNTTGLEEYGNDIGFSVYPVPSKGEINLVMKTPLEGTVRVRDVHGRIIRELEIHLNQSDYKFFNLMSGVYFIELSKQQHSDFVRKIIVQ